MENQHRKITGYRDLTQDEIDLMNEVKAKGIELDALLKKIADTNQALHEAGEPSPFSSEAFALARFLSHELAKLPPHPLPERS